MVCALLPSTQAKMVVETEVVRMTERGVAMATANPVVAEGSENSIGLAMAILFPTLTDSSAAAKRLRFELMLSNIL